MYFERVPGIVSFLRKIVQVRLSLSFEPVVFFAKHVAFFASYKKTDRPIIDAPVRAIKGLFCS